MAILARKAEVESVADAIEKATPDGLQAAAKAAIKAAYAALQERPGAGEKLDKGLWVVVVEGPRLYGPFGTYNEAEKALANSKIPNFEVNAERIKEDGLAVATGGTAMILPLMGPLAMARKAIEFDREARLFSNHLCLNCEQKSGKHNPKTSACPNGAGTKLKQITL